MTQRATPPDTPTKQASSRPFVNLRHEPEYLIGKQISHYRIANSAGRGGQAIVYRAIGVDTGVPVALKILLDAHDESHRKRFEREIQTLGALGRHPSIIDILDVGEYLNYPYLVMEYKITNMAEMLAVNPNGMEPLSAIRACVEIADALEFAHTRGIVHRDIKPSNILCDGPGTPIQVADFGLAFVRDQSPLTQPGHAGMGTLLYLAPECYGGKRGDARTDVFALGLTLAELITGDPPQRQSERVLMLPQLSRPIASEVCAIISRATDAAAANRFQTAGAFAMAMRKVIEMIENEPDQSEARTVLAVSPIPHETIEADQFQCPEGYAVTIREHDLYTVVHYRRRDGKAGLMRAADIARVQLPAVLTNRRHLGLVFSGAMPIWFYGYLMHLAHAFAWVATYDPRLPGAVVVARHTNNAPPVGTVVPVPQPE